MKAKFTLFLVAAAMLASCGTPSSSHPTGLSTPADTSVAPQGPKYLTWIAENKLVVDLYSIGEARFNYGNAALSDNSNTVDLNDASSLGCTTQLQGQTFNFIFVAETADSQSVAVHKAIEGDQLVSFCEMYKDTFKGKTRGYVAISGGTVQWAKGKNAELDAKIQQYL